MKETLREFCSLKNNILKEMKVLLPKIRADQSAENTLMLLGGIL